MKHAETPGQALLGSIQRSMPPAQRAAFDGFVDRNRAALVAHLDQWILDDSIEQSCRAIPDAVLFVAKRWEGEDLLLPLIGNYWAMHALVRRASERGPECRKKIVDTLKHYSLSEARLPHEDAATNAIIGRPSKRWSPPVYSRASAVDVKTAKGRSTLERRLLSALRRIPARSVPSLHREVGATRPQVRTALKRLARQGKVWSHKLQGRKVSHEALQHDPKLWDLTDKRTELPPSEYDELVLAALRQADDLTEAQIQSRVGGSALDVRASLDRLTKHVLTVVRGPDHYWFAKSPGGAKLEGADRAGAVLALVEKSSAPLTEAEIAAELGLGLFATQELLRVHKSAGRVVESGGGWQLAAARKSARPRSAPKTRVSTVVDELNKRFDLTLGEHTADLLSAVRDELVRAVNLRRAAEVNDKASFALVFAEALGDAMADHHADNTDFVNLFFDNRDLGSFVTKHLLDEVYSRIGRSDVPSRATAVAEPEPEPGPERGSREIKALAKSMPTKYLRLFFAEKDIPDRLFQVQGLQTTHQVPNAVVVEHIARTRGEERRKIEETLRALDMANGDINHFLKHLAEGLARQFDSPSNTAAGESRPKAPERTAQINIDDLDRDLATRAYAGTSHTPQRRADEDRAAYVAFMEKLRADVIKAGGDLEEFEAFRRKWLTRKREQLRRRQGLMSSMIVGPARFPSRQQRKASDLYDRKEREFSDWTDKERRRLLGIGQSSVIRSTDADAIERLQEKLQATEAHREVAKKANAILRQKKLTVPEKQAALAELGLSESTITNRLRFGPFHMANISSEVRRIKQRIAQLRDLAEDKARGEYEAYQRGPWSVTWDDEDGRVRVQGPKPATREATRAISAKFKRRGFRWSPRNEAYQRQATDSAWHAARAIVDEITEESGS